MQEKTIYVCGYCNKEYTTKANCIECENFHKKNLTIRYVDKYEPFTKKCESGFPRIIRVIADDGSEHTYYR